MDRTTMTVQELRNYILQLRNERSLLPYGDSERISLTLLINYAEGELVSRGEQLVIH